jgi:glucokinase
MKDKMILGIDIGGSHLTAALVDVHWTIDKESYTRIRVNSKGSAEEILTTWSTVINSVFQKKSITERKLGIAMPGPFDYEKGISLIKGLDKYEALYNLNIKEQLAERLQIQPTDIRMMNDAACFLAGEVAGGAAHGYTDVIGITLGTGMGSAMHHHGVTIDANLGPSPFKGGIADDYFSTRWFIKRYQELSGEMVQDVKALSILFPTDKRVQALFLEFVKNLTEFLNGFVRRENPAVIVMGGNIAQCADLFLEDLEANLIAAGITTPILHAKLGEDAAILGAASLFKG